MATSPALIRVSGLEVEVVRKEIKHLHIGVYPPTGRVRVATPARLDEEAVRLAVASRLTWIRRKRNQVREQARQSRREFVDGEAHYVWGRRYRLRIVEDGPRRKAELSGNGWLELHVRAGADREAKARRLNEWYREQIKAEIPAVVDRWQAAIGVPAPAWGVRRMKTRWGTCNPTRRKIWLNLELAKKPPSCLEYVVVHELIHLLERNHSPRFYELMDRFMPNWRTQQAILNREPLGHEDWGG